MDADKCKGCHSYDNIDGKCWAISYGCGFIGMESIDCPCANCLVKIMCNWACDDLIKVREEVHNKRTY